MNTFQGWTLQPAQFWLMTDGFWSNAVCVCHIPSFPQVARSTYIFSQLFKIVISIIFFLNSRLCIAFQTSLVLVNSPCRALPHHLPIAISLKPFHFQHSHPLLSDCSGLACSPPPRASFLPSTLKGPFLPSC